jgi:hypothetical protein
MPNRRDAKPKKGVEARIPFLRLVTVVTASYYFEPIRWRNAKRMYIVGMQIITLLAREATYLLRGSSLGMPVSDIPAGQ